ncbi:NPP1-domain-containing protein [Lentinus tigrinus ALCF2SS1-7]|uniref:NPP1-domain-containing protein n=1 Tax=Lentinus tigrinus ALCF2SS1-6 TaxID=1328759 RepID=A0A5C2S7W1_9APHY|nr:NPP1-domain-containing protein [Lentinus tigrinus ALCF2SS1-6]RPD72099.1 NPP1-domain-containing protein [Lentinus tigrinus ALCF2SS1-7]
MTLLSVGLSLLAAVGYAAGAAIGPRAVIAHDAVVGFPETVPNTAIGQLYLKYKPHLKVVNGCVPFPAVDAEGNTSGGLAPTGGTNAGCSSSTGQVYARSASFNNAFAIMYAWYMPKDEPSDGLGHRHDWEGIVVWIDDPNKAEPTLLGVAASAHGGFSTTTSPNLDGTSPLIQYFSIFPVDHQLGFTSAVGGTQPLIAYESLTDAARTALETTDFGSANVPFKDANFQNNLVKAEL